MFMRRLNAYWRRWVRSTGGMGRYGIGSVGDDGLQAIGCLDGLKNLIGIKVC